MAKILTGKNSTKKEAIIQKAALLFKSKSFAAASMRELAEALGVEAASLYNHIGSKSELLQAICSRIANKFTLQMEIIVARPAGVIDKIEAIIRFHIKMMLENFDEVYVANHEWKHLPEPFLSDFMKIRRNYEKALTELVETGIEKMELKKINSYVAVLTILSAVRGIEFWQRNKKNVDPKTLEDDMVDHLLIGIRRTAKSENETMKHTNMIS